MLNEEVIAIANDDETRFLFFNNILKETVNRIQLEEYINSKLREQTTDTLEDFTNDIKKINEFLKDNCYIPCLYLYEFKELFLAVEELNKTLNKMSTNNN